MEGKGEGFDEAQTPRKSLEHGKQWVEKDKSCTGRFVACAQASAQRKSDRMPSTTQKTQKQSKKQRRDSEAFRRCTSREHASKSTPRSHSMVPSMQVHLNKACRASGYICQAYHYWYYKHKQKRRAHRRESCRPQRFFAPPLLSPLSW